MDKRKALPMNNNLKGFAKNFRKNQTPQEKKLWYDYLSKVKPNFHRQRIIGNYIVDFYCPKLSVVIEVDGFQHYFSENWEYDKKRTEYLESIGYSVLRFDNEDIIKSFDYVTMKIKEHCTEKATALNITEISFDIE